MESAGRLSLTLSEWDRWKRRGQKPPNHDGWLGVKGGSTRREIPCGCVEVGLRRKRDGVRPVTGLGSEGVGDESPAPSDPASCNARGTSESGSRDCCGKQFGGCEHGAVREVHPTPAASRPVGGEAADTPLRRARSNARFGIDGCFARGGRIPSPVADGGCTHLLRACFCVDDAAGFEPFFFGSGCADSAPAASRRSRRLCPARASGLLR